MEDRYAVFVFYYAFWKAFSSNFCLKVSILVIKFSSDGRQFHVLGPRLDKHLCFSAMVYPFCLVCLTVTLQSASWTIIPPSDVFDSS